MAIKNYQKLLKYYNYRLKIKIKYPKISVPKLVLCGAFPENKRGSHEPFFLTELPVGLERNSFTPYFRIHLFQVFVWKTNGVR